MGGRDFNKICLWIVIPLDSYKLLFFVRWRDVEITSFRYLILTDITNLWRDIRFSDSFCVIAKGLNYNGMKTNHRTYSMKSYLPSQHISRFKRVLYSSYLKKKEISSVFFFSQLSRPNQTSVTYECTHSMTRTTTLLNFSVVLYQG